MSEPSAWTLCEAADAVAAGRISSRELVTDALGRLERGHRHLNCVIRLDADAALAQAKAADAARSRGATLGKLHGVPLAHKDMYYRAGRVSTCGSKIRRDETASSTATALERLDAAGQVDLGTLNMAEFAFGPTGHNWHFGHCRNPWNTAHVTGGSSSGSGASVAARLVYGALGSDTGGSIRLPAAICGVVGIKPTYGRVSRAGAMPLSFSLDTVGPLVRSVRDAARLLGVIAGHDPRDPTSSTEPVPDYEAALGVSVKGMRIGLATGYFAQDVAPEVAAGIADMAARCRALGAEIVEIAPPGLDEVNALFPFVIATEAAAFHASWFRTRAQDYSDQVRRRIEIGFGVGAVQYLEALRARARILAAFSDAVFGKVDALLAPVIPFAVPTIAATDLGGGPAMAAMLGGFTRFTRPINYLGLPSLSLPCGFDAAGLPIGCQLVGRPFAEATLFRLGHALEEAGDWTRRAPSLPS